jgi:Tol biopolymer transport system component
VEEKFSEVAPALVTAHTIFVVQRDGALVTLPLGKGREEDDENYPFGALTAAAGVLVAVGMLVLIMVALVEPAGAAFPGKNGKIVFSTNRDGNYEIYTMNSDRTGPPSSWDVKRLTNNQANDTDPAFSADGSKIAFVSERDGNSEIYTMNTDGTGLNRITNDPAGDIQPAFSPGGSGQSRLVFTSTRDTFNPVNQEIYTIDSNGSGLVARHTTNDTQDSDPAFSPDGNKIAFRSRRDGNSEIYLLTLGTLGLQRLTNNPAPDLSPNFSPNGSKIAFTSFRDGGNPEIYTMNANGTGQTRITNDPGIDFDPAFSPDGSWIVFSETNGGNAEIYTKKLDGTRAQRLTSTAEADVQPDWQPLP